MGVTLACDHRILYGADGAEFLARVRALLEEPLGLALVIREAAIPERLIDVPLESLPYIDEHSTVHRRDSGPRLGRRWSRRSATGGRSRCGPAVARSARLRRRLEPAGRPGRIGSTIPGFIVTRSIAPAVLALMGEHRFSRYALIFYAGGDRRRVPVRLSAETRAEFPGLEGPRLSDAGNRHPRTRDRDPLDSPQCAATSRTGLKDRPDGH